MEALYKYASRTFAAVGLVGALLAIDGQNSINAQTKSPFKEDRILNVSLRDYVDSVGKKLSDYRMNGVYVHNAGFQIPERCETILAEKVGKNFPNAEVVINFNYHPTNYYVCYGVVLIPK